MNTPVTLRLPARNVPVARSYEVAVVGGGIAGVAAAVAAARAGASVALIERTISLGGLATVGNVTFWLPICDGRGRQIIAGIGEELMRLSVSDLAEENNEASFKYVPECWNAKRVTPAIFAERRAKRFACAFNPASYTLLLEKWVRDAGVEIFYDTRLVDVKRRGKSVTHVIVENKSGTLALECGAVIDASGDADVAYLAGEETESLDSNVACGWFYYLKKGVANIYLCSHGFHEDLRKPASELNCKGYRGDRGSDVSAMVMESHDMMLGELQQIRAKEGAEVQPFALPTIPCFRSTRRLVGKTSLEIEDRHVWKNDAVALTSDWRHVGPVYAITLDMLRGVRARNLFAVGRCMSSAKSVWDCTRVIPPCAVTGEAAGIAAAMVAKNGSVSAFAVQRAMKAAGNLISKRLVAEAE